MAVYSPFTSDLTRRSMRAEMLDAETETDLARRWRDDRDAQALHRLIQAYMRLAISMAGKFRRTGLSYSDLIQEASLGLMKAADRFDPDRGVRFSTYAVWWIRAGLQDHVMRNWSLVRTGSTTSQKSLFFNLRRVQARLEREALARGETLDSHQVCERISTEIGVSLADTEMMMGRMSGSDMSLNATQSTEDSGREWVDLLEDEAALGAESVVKRHDHEVLQNRIDAALGVLNPREQFIVRQRRLQDETRTLADLGQEMGLSKERVRQLEAAAMIKMRTVLERDGLEVHDLVS
ncbi:RNA polymerase, sigma 32 subunit, RpoH [Shimia gijangensis]|uniref:RNA polymerase, sigma 32 subunit, RpoH n=1 Tax=Shimia gijangensis TaxID=1470563 RepID=A0A1M6FS33_9RHOB|nr:RNA polymerase factor sigma-32 [Shimia gijangensis]SHJ00511.1 RNA polymerase, sigma 32 subunit, RpoH [Shimia gijangensis]